MLGYPYLTQLTFQVELAEGCDHYDHWEDPRPKPQTTWGEGGEGGQNRKGEGDSLT